MNPDEPDLPPPPAPMNAHRALPPGMENASPAEIIEYMRVQALKDMLHIQHATIQAHHEFQSTAIQAQREVQNAGIQAQREVQVAAMQVQGTYAMSLDAISAFLMNLPVEAAQVGQNRQSDSEAPAASTDSSQVTG